MIRSNVPLRKRSGATSVRVPHWQGLCRANLAFPSSISYVIEAGEATGNLGPILRKVIDYLEEKEAIRKKMIASMVYPAFICTVAIAVVILFMTVLLPQIQGMLDRLGGEMTWSVAY